MSKQSDAKSKAQDYKNMSASQLNTEYDNLRAGNDVNAAEVAGLAMHKAYFNKSDETSTPISTNNPTSTNTPEAPKPGKVETPLAKPEASAEFPEFNPSNALYYGDSIATGLGHGGARGNADSDAMWGRGAADTLALLNNRPEGTFKGRDVVLSSGVLNSGADWDTVRSQVRLLQNRGANSIRLVGAPSGSDRFSGYNENLSSISDELGVNFLGGYTPGNDGVHFDYTNSPVYRPLQ